MTGKPVYLMARELVEWLDQYPHRLNCEMFLVRNEDHFLSGQRWVPYADEDDEVIASAFVEGAEE